MCIRDSVELADILWAGAPIGLRLHVDAVNTAELVEVVHIVRSDIGVEHREDVFDAHAFGFGKLSIDVDEKLRRVGAERAEDACDLRLTIRREDEAVEHGRQRLWRAALAILQDEFKACLLYTSD